MRASLGKVDVEQNYGSFDGECLAVVWATSHFRPYLFGSSFTLVTNHEPLKWIMTTEKMTGKLTRWSILLREYDFVVANRAGVEYTNSDCISRYPLPSSSGAPALDWAKGEIMAPTICMAMMVGLFSCVEDREEDKDIWDDVKVLRFLQTYKAGNDLSVRMRDRIYKPAKNCR